MQNRLALLWNLLVVFCNFYLHESTPSATAFGAKPCDTIVAAFAVCLRYMFMCDLTKRVAMLYTNTDSEAVQHYINVQTQIML